MHPTTPANFLFVIPANAGIQCRHGKNQSNWFPAFAGMTSVRIPEIY
jgi:hypothetical protein